MAQKAPGTIGWLDITVEDATALRDFYSAVAGWQSSAIPMGGGAYEDYAMLPSAGADDAVAGICHARGGNTGIPPMWIPYIIVADLDASLAACRERGGETVGEVRNYGSAGRWCIIRDPAGACAALFQQQE